MHTFTCVFSEKYIFNNCNLRTYLYMLALTLGGKCYLLTFALVFLRNAYVFS